MVAAANALEPSRRIPAYVVAQRIAHLPPEQQKEITWLHRMYYDENLSMRDVGRRIGYDSSVVCWIFRGEYKGNVGVVTDKIAAYRAEHEARKAAENVTEMPFIADELTEQFATYADLARRYRRIVQIFGESQIGKTTNAEHLRDSDREGKTVLVEVLPGASLAEFIAALCVEIRMGCRQRSGELKLNIASWFRARPGALLIVDEGARAGGDRNYGGGSFRVLEFIRWLHDKGEMGVMYLGTNTTRDAMRDEQHKKYLNQWNRRALKPVQLPDVPSEKSLAMHAAQFGLPPPTGAARTVERTIIARDGLGQWRMYLTMGRVRAAGKPVTWDHVIRAVGWVSDISDAKRRDDNSDPETKAMLDTLRAPARGRSVALAGKAVAS